MQTSEKILLLYREGTSIEAISDMFKMDSRRVRSLIKRQQIKESARLKTAELKMHESTGKEPDAKESETKEV